MKTLPGFHPKGAALRSNLFLKICETIFTPKLAKYEHFSPEAEINA